ncbi:FMN-binding protein [Fusibacter paucivorans]|uniref:FMN-binding protein n=2 Tax=Fusibacter paucivorans TaxID=76009 RepID=A0ABS5PLW1_9FIRM|nr:FMN-binding protein [Fusibacter paucivorans]
MGPVFCGWICPFGILQDLMIRLSNRLHIKRKVLPEKVHRALKPLRYLLFGISILLAVDFIFTLFSFDPRSGFEMFLAGNTVTAIGWGIIAGFLLLGLFYERPFCNTLCIEGAKYGLLSIAKPFAVVRNSESCISCGLCDRACPMHLTVSTADQVRSPQCISCMNCVAACPKDDALSFRIAPYPKRQIQLIATAAILFIVFFVKFGGLNQTADLSSITIDDLSIDTETLSNGGDATGVANGTYIGTGTGFRGTMSVDVTVEDEVITAIQITDMSDDARWLNRAYNTVASSIISEQTANVDTVSGATYSSMGIKEAVSDALVSAGSTVAEVIENDVDTSKRQHSRKSRDHAF